jgi:hypothetical protein
MEIFFRFIKSFLGEWRMIVAPSAIVVAMVNSMYFYPINCPYRHAATPCPQAAC